MSLLKLRLFWTTQLTPSLRTRRLWKQSVFGPPVSVVDLAARCRNASIGSNVPKDRRASHFKFKHQDVAAVKTQKTGRKTGEKLALPKDKTEEAQPEEKKSKKLRTSKSKLNVEEYSILRRRKSEPGFPHPHKVAILTRAFVSINGIGLDRLEAFLLRDQASTIPEAADLWTQGERQKGFLLLCKAYEDMEANGLKSDMRERAAFAAITIRFCQIMEDVVKREEASELKDLETLCEGASQEFDSHTLAFFFWLTLVKTEEDRNLMRAQRLLSKLPSLLNHLDRYLRFFTRHISLYGHKEDFQKKNALPNHILPIALNVESHPQKINSFFDCLTKALPQNAECRELGQLQAYQGLSLWHSGQFSEALACTAAAFKVLGEDLKELAAQDSEAEESQGIADENLSQHPLQPLAKGAVAAFAAAARGASTRRPETLDQALALAERLAKETKTILAPYILYFNCAVSQDVSARKIAAHLISKFPEMEHLRDSELEKAFTDDKTTSYKRDMANELFCHNLIRNVSTVLLGEAWEEESHDLMAKEDDVPTKILTDSLDVKVLRCLQHGKIQEAVNVTGQQGASGGIFVSMEVLKQLVEQCLKKAPEVSSTLMASLASSAPFQSEAADYICTKNLEHNLRHNHATWRLKRNQDYKNLSEPLVTLSKLYQTLLEEEFHYTFETLDEQLQRIKDYFRLYLEESFGLSQEAQDIVLSTVEGEADVISRLHRDFSVSITYWEALFFSPHFKHQQQADQFFSDHPNLPQYVDVDRALRQADLSDDGDVFRRLLEICLRYDLDDYHKTRALEGLLIYQCERGQFHNAAATFKSAEEINVRLGADAVAAYIELQKDLKNPKRESIFTTITGIFNRHRRPQ